MTATMKVKVLVGCNYPPDDTRAEPGDVIDVPEDIAKALIRADAAKPVKAKPQKPVSGPQNPATTGTTTQGATGDPDGGGD